MTTNDFHFYFFILGSVTRNNIPSFLYTATYIPWWIWWNKILLRICTITSWYALNTIFWCLWEFILHNLNIVNWFLQWMVACLIPKLPLAIKNSSINGLFCNAYSFQNVIFLTLISYHRFMPLHLIAFITFIEKMIQFVVGRIRNFFGLFLK